MSGCGVMPWQDVPVPASSGPQSGVPVDPSTRVDVAAGAQRPVHLAFRSARDEVLGSEAAGALLEIARFSHAGTARVNPAAWLGLVTDSHAGAVPEAEPLDLREISSDQAAHEILEYLTQHPGSDAFDIALARRLDTDFVEDIAEQLVRQGRLVRGDHTLGEPPT